MGKADWHHLYDTKRWKALRLLLLGREPTCRLCRQRDRLTAACVVDHRQPHKGDVTLFYDESNLHSLCKTCHDGTKQRQEHRGFAQGVGADGRPLDPGHRWNRYQ